MGNIKPVMNEGRKVLFRKNMNPKFSREHVDERNIIVRMPEKNEKASEIIKKSVRISDAFFFITSPQVRQYSFI